SSQQRKKTTPPAKTHTAKPRPAPAKPAPKPARMIGSTIVIITKNEDRIAGELLDLSPYSVRIKSENLESTIALDTIDSIVFGPVAQARPSADPVAPQSTVP